MGSAVAVIGAGVAGLAAAHTLKKKASPGTRVLLIEQSSKAGGKVSTERHGDFLVETGPESVVSYKPSVIQLCREIGLGDELIEPRPENRNTFVLFKGRLVEMPEGVLSIFSQPLTRLAAVLLSTKLLSPLSKLRLALEPFIPRNPSADDESVESFFSRRLGKEFFQNLLEPILSGVYGGEAGSLSMKSLMGSFYEAERKHGSLYRAVLNSNIPKTKERKSVFVTLRNGLGALPEKLVSLLDREDVMLGEKASGLAKEENGYKIVFENGETLSARQVLLALPAPAAARLIRSFNEELSSILASIPYASSTVLTFGFEKNDLRNPLAGSGFIVPKKEKLPITACTWSSSKWENRAPEGKALIRLYAEGNTDDPEKLKESVLEHLKPILGIERKPILSLVHLHPGAMPRYLVGHREKIETISKLVGRHPGLFLAGSAYHGVGIPDCVESGRAAAERIAAGLQTVPVEG